MNVHLNALASKSVIKAPPETKKEEFLCERWWISCVKKRYFRERMHSPRSSRTVWWCFKRGSFSASIFWEKTYPRWLKNDTFSPLSKEVAFPYNLYTFTTTINAFTRRSLENTRTPLRWNDNDDAFRALGRRTVDEHGFFVEFREKIIVEIIVDVRQQREDDDDDEIISVYSET